MALRAGAEKREWLDLGLFLALTIAVWFLLGWSPSKTIAGHDAHAMLLPYLVDLAEAGGGWLGAAYRPQVMGGAKVHDVVGTFDMVSLGLVFGLSPTGISNLVMIFIQWLTGWLGVRLGLGVARLVGGGLLAESRVARAALFLLVAFSPVIGWKITHGHMYLLAGCWPWMAVLALALAWVDADRGVTLTETLIAILAVYSAFTSTGQQAVVYSAVFGLPLTVALAALAARVRGPGETLRGAVFALGAALLGLLISLPRLVPMMIHAFGPDAARSAAGESVIYAYTTAEWSEWWWKSFFWSLSIIPMQMPEILWHEVNNPGGPILLLSLALSRLSERKRGWIVLSGVAVSFAMIALFATNTTPWSTAIASVFSMLKSFRVPQRAMVPFLLALIPVSVAWMPGVVDSGKPRVWVIAAIAGLATWFFPAGPREVLGWVAAGGLMAAATGWVRVFAPWGRQMVLVIPALFCLVGSSVGAFAERMVPFFEAGPVVQSGASLRQQIVSRIPETAGAFTRIAMEIQSQPFAANSGWVTGFSGIDGYWFAPKRYLELYLALDGTPFNPTVNFIRAMRGSRPFEPLRQLYNVCCAVSLSPDGATVLSQLGPTAGPAWFVARSLDPVGSVAELAAALQAQGNQLASAARERAWLIGSDPAVPSDLPRTLDPRCRNAKVEAVDAPQRSQRFGFRVSGVQAECPLVVATNYVSTLSARAVLAGGFEKPLRLFPAYGSLVAFLVPPETTEIRMEATVPVPGWARVAFWIGCLALLALIGGAFALSRLQGPPPEDGAVPAADGGGGGLLNAKRKHRRRR